MSLSAALRTVFMGSPELALPSLRLLAERSQLQLVVTQPDRPAGRGRTLAPPPVKRLAEELQLPLWQPETLRHDDGAFLRDIDLVVVLAYGELLREPLLSAPRHDCINLHASLLPRWRGASPLQAAIRAGERESGVSVMRMVRALDAGPVFHQRRFDLPPRVTLPWLHDRIAEESALALGDYLEHFLDQQPQPQDPAQVTTCGKLSSSDGCLHWAAGMQAVDRQLRAYEPVPGCWSLLPDGQRLRLRSGEPCPAVVLPPGRVAVQEGQLLVGCGDGSLAITSLQPPGKRAMDGRSFINGYPIPEYVAEG